MRAAHRPHQLPWRRAVPARMPPAASIWLVAAGGGAGTLVRVAVGQLTPAASGSWPWATLAVNLSGAFLLAVLLTLVTEQIAAAPWVRPLLGTGVLGAYTTFSTLALETEQLLAIGRIPMAIAYAVASIAGGLVAALAGVVLVRARPRRSGAAG